MPSEKSSLGRGAGHGFDRIPDDFANMAQFYHGLGEISSGSGLVHAVGDDVRRLCSLLQLLNQPCFHTALRQTKYKQEAETIHFITLSKRYLLGISRFVTLVRAWCKSPRSADIPVRSNVHLSQSLAFFSNTYQSDVAADRNVRAPGTFATGSS